MSKEKQTYYALEDGQLTEKNVPKPKTANSRSRKFALISYIDRDSVIDFLKRSKWVCHWSVCRHDRDLNSDGSPKMVHTHILLYTYEAKTSSAVNRLFDIFSKELYENTDNEVQNTLVQVCKDMVFQYRYLIHADDEDKVPYEKIERITDNDNYWHSLEASAGMTSADYNKALAMFDDYISGVPIREMTARFGQNFIMNYSKLKLMKEDHYYECLYRKGSDSIDDIIRSLLDENIYPKSVVDCFFRVYDYLQTEVYNTRHEVLDFYLRPSTNNDLKKYSKLKGD